tara:strand:- start:155 stop:289 length:135 start_codon:yes stop_codon:yes gene_type:complete
MRKIAKLIVETVNKTKDNYGAIEQTEEILIEHFPMKKINKQSKQ